MNPFEEEFSNELNNKISLIEIWVEVNGRKRNTFISGWNLSDSELKEKTDFVTLLKRIDPSNSSKYQEILE